MAALQTIGGLVLLLGGAEILVRGAVGLAERVGVSKMVIGMTIVAFGTSAPELVVSLDAALTGVPGLAVGNIVGSNIANILLIIGATAMILPFATKSDGSASDSMVMIVGTLSFVGLCYFGMLGKMAGIILVVLFVAFLVYSWWRERSSDSTLADDVDAVPHSIPLAIAMLFGGIAGVVFGADILVEGAVFVARAVGVSEAAIGLTLVAFGTSVPELATSVVAALRRHADVALGNIVGSNMFNMLGIGGVVSLVTDLPVDQSFMTFDLPVVLLATLMLIVMMWAGRTIGRVVGVGFLGFYTYYILAQFYAIKPVL
ncbi:calcium/sodium antiporter [Alphaproteobacteria bacterium HT1-32]|nr:calcium/sodium antiporter [Alphaproteobacteria bacterium HT1-32]